MCILVRSCCFFKQKTAYEVRISDWSSDVCSSDLGWRWCPRQTLQLFQRCGRSRHAAGFRARQQVRLALRTLPYLGGILMSLIQSMQNGVLGGVIAAAALTTFAPPAYDWCRGDYAPRIKVNRSERRRGGTNRCS